MTETKTSAKPTAAGKSFTDDEKAAMRERARELKAESKSRDARADGERDLLAKIAEMPPADRSMAERIHALITAGAPDLAPKTWYGMPAYARDGKVVCFFKSCGQVQVAVRDARLRGRGPPGRRRDVADLVRPEGADRRRRGSDRRARGESVS